MIGEDDGQEELEAIQRRITAAMIRHTNQFSITLHEYHPINHQQIEQKCQQYAPTT